MAIFFTADTHFGDHRTINIYKRPFASVAEMDAHISTRWNEVVRPDVRLEDLLRSKAC